MVVDVSVQQRADGPEDMPRQETSQLCKKSHLTHHLDPFRSDTRQHLFSRTRHASHSILRLPQTGDHPCRFGPSCSRCVVTRSTAHATVGNGEIVRLRSNDSPELTEEFRRGGVAGDELFLDLLREFG